MKINVELYTNLITLVPEKNEIQVMIEALDEYLKFYPPFGDVDKGFIANRLITTLRTAFER
jgi:hypothetical protein